LLLLLILHHFNVVHLLGGGGGQIYFLAMYQGGECTSYCSPSSSSAIDALMPLGVWAV
jgi:hypothetical protein